MSDAAHSSPSSTLLVDRTARSGLAKVIPRRRRVTWVLGVAFALVFAILVTPSITAERWLASMGVGLVAKDHAAPITVRVPAFAGFNAGDLHVSPGVVIARGQIAKDDVPATVEAVIAATQKGPLPYAAFFVLTLVIAIIFTHHMQRSTLGRLVRVQVMSLLAVALLATTAKILMLNTAVSILVVPVSLLAMVPTMVLDRVVGLATGVLAALTIALLGPFDLGVAILMLVQASAAGLLVAERPRRRWRSALVAGGVTTLFTVATYALLMYLTTGSIPAIRADLDSPWIAAAIGPATAMVLAVPLIPLYQLLVGEITQGKLVELEDLSNPLLKQIAERAPGTWQHSLAMANMAENAASAIGANGRLVRVGAYYHDLGKSLSPKHFIENLEPGETSPHDRLPPEMSCDAIFSHVTEGIVTARKAGLHERIVDFMHMHHGNGVLEYFWAKAREQGNPNNFTVEDFRYPGHPPQTRETAILAITDAVEAASRTLKNPTPAQIDSLVQRIVYGKLHLGQLDESGLSMSDLRRINDSLRETIRHANHGRIEYPWQKAQQDASASVAQVPLTTGETSQLLRLDSLDRKPQRQTVQAPNATPSTSMPIELGPADRKSSDPIDSKIRTQDAIAETTDLKRPQDDLAIVETAPALSRPDASPQREPASASRPGVWSSAPGPADSGPAVPAPPVLPSNLTMQGPPAGVLPTGDPAIPPVPASGMGPARQRPSDTDFERETARSIDDPPLPDEVPAGANALGPAPDVIGPSTFAGVLPPRPANDSGVRKRAATLSPAPRRSSPTLPPQQLTTRPGPAPAPASEAKPALRPPAQPAQAAAPAEPVARASSGLAGGKPVSSGTLIGPPVAASGLAAGPVDTRTAPDGTSLTLPGTDPIARRRAPTVPSDPPITRLAERAATDPSAWSATPAEPIRRSNEPPALRDPAKRPSEPPKRVDAREPQTTLAAQLPLRAPAPVNVFSTRDTLPTPNDPAPPSRVLPTELPRPEPPLRPSDPMNTTLRGSSPGAPSHLPASVSPARFPAEPSPEADASAPNLRPSTPTATPTRIAGPPEPVDLDGAITNPPPLRRGGKVSPAPNKDVTRLPGILLQQEAIDHDARLEPMYPDDDGGELRATAPRARVTPPAGVMSGEHPLLDDAGRTEPSLPRVELPLQAPPTDDPPKPSRRAQDGSWASGLASRVDRAIDEWGVETPIAPPSKAELRSLLGSPDPTKEQSLDELERLHEATRDLRSDPAILPPRNISVTHEVDPDDIEASIEVAPKARTHSPSAIGVAKKPTK